ncbi:hypothetical protein PTKIN_Ptkin01aG0368100 [Pterospermum kingtungense]
MQKSVKVTQVAVMKRKAERSMLKIKKQEALAKLAAEEKLVDDFMPFFIAIENNDLDAALKFDEKAMMNTIATMMNGNGGFP